jgi:hypothetical protein
MDKPVKCDKPSVPPGFFALCWSDGMDQAIQFDAGLRIEVSATG